jgi:hypothetical protein
LIITFNSFSAPLLSSQEEIYEKWLADFEKNLLSSEALSQRAYIKLTLSGAGTTAKSSTFSFRVTLNNEPDQVVRFLRLLKLIKNSRLFSTGPSGQTFSSPSVVILIDGGSRVFRLSVSQVDIADNPAAQLFLRLMKFYSEPSADDVSPEMFIAKQKKL